MDVKPIFPLDNEAVNLALKIAILAHEGQTRKDGKTPYITHPIYVANRIWESYGEVNSPMFRIMASVALLHDVLEDTSTTEQDLLEQGISQPVVDAVVLLTRLDESYLDYILKVRAVPTARPIKFADIGHNLQTSTGTMKDKYELALYILGYGT